MHYFLYPDVFLNQNIVNDYHPNLSSDNHPSSCSENSTSRNNLNANHLIRKTSSFVFFDSVSSD